MMTTQAGLLKLGIFVRRGFLDEMACAKLCQAISYADLVPAEVYDGATLSIAPEVRQTRQTLLGGALRAEVQERLHELTPSLAGHFKLPLTNSEGVSFLLYEPGGFFRTHRDRTAPGTTRLVSAVLFLNARADCPGPTEYSGGQLTLYGLLPEAPDIGFPVEAEPGLLVAFPAATLHEVTPVREGRRMTAVDWFF